MSKFTELQTLHNNLLTSQESDEKIVEGAKSFIEQARIESSEIYASRERDQIRSFQRYWASYIYEQTGSFPDTELSPVSKRAGVQRIGKIIQNVFFGFVVIALISLYARDWFEDIFQPTPAPTQAAVSPEVSTETPSPTASITSIPTSTEILPTFTKEVLPDMTEAASAITEIAPMPTPSVEVIDPSSIFVKMASPDEGEITDPNLQFSGSFGNLQAGWTIHVIVRPLSKNGLLFPLENTFQVRRTSGEWLIDGRLLQNEDLTYPEEYNLSVVVSLDEATREALSEASNLGMKTLPAGVIPFPETITVSRKAMVEINEPHLIFLYIDPETNTGEVFGLSLDSKEFRQLTFDPILGEVNPSIAPDGKTVAFVSQVINEWGTHVYSLYTTNIENPDERTLRVLAPDQTTVYESPVWSPKGDYIALSIGEKIEGVDSTVYRIVLYDVDNQKEIPLIGGLSKPYPFWLDENTLVYTARIRGSSGFMKIDIPTKETSTFYNTNQEERWGAKCSDSSLFAYLVQLEGYSHEIFVVDLDVGDPSRLTDNIYQDQSPVWSPDCTTIYFTSFTTEIPSIKAVDINGRKESIIFSGNYGITYLTLGNLRLFFPMEP